MPSIEIPIEHVEQACAHYQKKKNVTSTLKFDT